MVSRALFSSVKPDWCTPGWFFENLNSALHFTVDAAANPFTALLPDWIGPGHPHPYRQDFRGRIWPGQERYWINPPYIAGPNGLTAFMRTVARNAEQGRSFAVLVPVRTDTQWWRQYVAPLTTQWLFVTGRLKFEGGGRNTAPFPSVVLLYNMRHPGIAGDIGYLSNKP